MQTATEVQLSELRLGNYVIYPTYEDEGITDWSERQLEEDDFIELFQRSDIFVKPIQLTPERLEQCGFEKDGNRYHKSGTLFYIVEVERRFYVEYAFGTGHAFSTTYLLNLHQLQNYFFASEHKELEIVL